MSAELRPKALEQDRARPKDYDRLSTMLADVIGQRADWPAAPSVDVREHVERVARVVVDAHRRAQQ